MRKQDNDAAADLGYILHYTYAFAYCLDNDTALSKEVREKIKEAHKAIQDAYIKQGFNKD